MIAHPQHLAQWSDIIDILWAHFNIWPVILPTESCWNKKHYLCNYYLQQPKIKHIIITLWYNEKEILGFKKIKEILILGKLYRTGRIDF